MSNPSAIDMSHLDAPALRRILDRHVRWREKALRLLEQVNNGFEGEWPELADFISRSTSRPVLAEKTKCSQCAEGMNSFTDPDSGNVVHARNGVVVLCSAYLTSPTCF